MVISFLADRSGRHRERTEFPRSVQVLKHGVEFAEQPPGVMRAVSPIGQGAAAGERG